MASALDEQLKRRTEECTVKIPQHRVTGGSGFFVAPGIVLSCGHVVLDRETGNLAETVSVEWNGTTTHGTVRAVRGPGPWAYPDLCVIELADPPPEHPWVLLGDLDPSRGSELYLTGYNKVYDPENPRFQGTLARLDGPRELEGGLAWQFADCEVAEGMSGGPLLQIRAGLVVGVTKMRRLADSTMGGLMIPADAIRQAFPDIWERNREGERNAQRYGLWLKQRDRLDPLADRLQPEQREHMVRTAEELGLGRQDFSGLWQQIADDLAPDPEPMPDTILDLARELAELPAEPTDPLTELIARLDRWPRGQDAVDPSAGARTIGGSRKPAQLTGSPADGRGDRMAVSLPVLVVRLDPYGPDPEKNVRLTIWRYASPGRRPRKVKCNPGPYRMRAVRALERAITDALSREFNGLLGGRMSLIEFVLPDPLLDEAVEKWKVREAERRGEAPYTMGTNHHVVIRFADRRQGEKDRWQLWRDQFRTGNLPAHGSASWEALWVGCEDPRTSDELDNMLRSTNRVPLIAMTAWQRRGRALPAAVAAGRHAGAPVIVWQHKPCADHPASAGNGAAAACRGGRFQQAAADHMSAVGIAELPEQVRQARLAAMGGNGDCFGQDIAILWDDPDRQPWQKAPRNRAPKLPGQGEL